MSSLLDTSNTLDPTSDLHAASCTGCLDRRQVLARAGLVTMGVAAAGVLAACGGGSSGGSADGAGDASSSGASGGALAKLSDIPEGGALAVEDADGNPLILTQPTAGTVVALSAICTHQGCTVAAAGDQLVCPCHGSVYDMSGGNISGPAPDPLPEVDVHVTNGEVLAGKA
ncbi:ubiquinol-cytochrome c reductase iron-sulfur subunit [Cellulomonas sp. URHE0023]|uniref:QcrA and Rieske domain-containing protein n=1 Tax=Cellulomonas sp. URHE0023 TaxID=1380354 RepID=UPI0009DD815C|nr:Rieske (2Fe-2S) protein [Cellulomonas sp. URHE0023]